MPDRNSYDYAVIRIVPFVERQEFINIGVILFCKRSDYLEAMIDFDFTRLKALAPEADLHMIESQLQTILTICSGDSDAGYFSTLSKSERFHWLVSPSSTIIQASPVHCGISDDPSQALKNLYEMLVTRN